jgi:predicted negative regulator of RcsB-dependent stress response
MISGNTNKYFAKRDILLITVLIFIVVVILVTYEAYQKSKTDTQDISVDIPPVLINKIDTSIFEKLKTMSE